MALLQEVRSGTSRSETHALIRALADSDGETYAHSLQVAATATELARRLGLHDDALIDIEFGALLHDIGKLCLPQRLLSKPGPLTEAERRLIRMHPDWGAGLVESIPGLEEVAAIVRFHHERPDGTGYPRGPRLRRHPDGRADRLGLRRLWRDDEDAALPRGAEARRRPRLSSSGTPARSSTRTWSRR